MYTLTSPIDTIEGIGPKLLEKFEQKNIKTFKDLLLFLPLRYSDRSDIVQINDLEIDKLVSFQATISGIRSFYKNKRKIDTAVANDQTGKVKLMWFNNKFVAQNIKPNIVYMISGKLNNRGTILQPTIEKISNEVEREDKTKDNSQLLENNSKNIQKLKAVNLQTETIHTGRLVPIYSSTLDIPQGTLRRILKKALSKYKYSNRDEFFETPENLLSIKEALLQLHFPDSEESIVKARERLALEELLSLIQTSHKIKKYWKNLHSADAITVPDLDIAKCIPNSIPFELTLAQKRCVTEIMSDIKKTEPMNRVLIGDVGSGKTVVAGIAAWHIAQNNKSVALIAPTKILAEQHFQTLQKLFPDMKTELITSKQKSIAKKNKAVPNIKNTQHTAKLYIGTHALINKIGIIKPALIIFDEQHRFGVNQRSQSQKLTKIPHTLTMTATPIPRSLMLTIFSHLHISTIDELPAGRIQTKTWVVPETKRQSAYEWIMNELKDEKKVNSEGNITTASTKSAKLKIMSEPHKKLVLIVCPFIDPSNHEAFENIASVKETYQTVTADFQRLGEKNKQKVQFGLLHGRMKAEEQSKVITDLYNQKIEVLVTTPIVEVGVDLPTASIMVIEAAERFGMASLHQLRGRVGRAGQQGYCLLFSSAKSAAAQTRLQNFSKENNGLKLAELDLQSRGSGDIFGTQQSGLSNLQFASWTNLSLIGQAKQIYETLPKDWRSFFTHEINQESIKPLAN